MKNFLIGILFLFCLDLTATNYPVPVICWNNIHPQFDTTVYAAPGDSLSFINNCTSFAAFNIYINGSFLMQSPGTMIGNVIYTRPLTYLDTVITLYIPAQIQTYGQRCHVHFLNTSVSSAPQLVHFNVSGRLLLAETSADAAIEIFDMNGRLLKQESIAAASKTEMDLSALPQGCFVAVIRSGEQIVARRKFVIVQ